MQVVQSIWNTTGSRVIIGLTTDPAFAPTDDSTTAYITSAEATFAGYARCSVTTWSGPTEEEVGFLDWILTAATPCRFCRTSTGTCQTVYGWFGLSEATGEWIMAEKAWPAGIPFCAACDCLNLTPVYSEQALVPGHS